MRNLLLKVAPTGMVLVVLLAGGCKEPEKVTPADASGASPMSGPPASTGKIPGVGGTTGAPPGHGAGGAMGGAQGMPGR